MGNATASDTAVATLSPIPQNDTLRYLTARLTEAPPTWDAAVARFKERPQYRCGGMDTGAIAGFLAEDWVHASLERICQEMGNSVQPCRIEDGLRIGRYEFRYRSNGYHLTIREAGQDAAELDAVLVVDNLPVVFEVRSGAVPPATGPAHVMRKLAPIKELFRRSCGYVLVAPRGYVAPSAFQQNGGMLVSLPWSRAEYKQREVPDVIRRHELTGDLPGGAIGHRTPEPLREVLRKRRKPRRKLQYRGNGDLWMWNVTKP